MPEDDIIIHKAQAGDREALNTLMSNYWHPIYHFVSYKMSSLEDAQEITQETFLRAFRSLPNYKQQAGATFKTYLSRIALNLITDFWRKNGRNLAVTDLAEYQELASSDDPPDMQTITQETREEIAFLIRSLPKEQQQTIELRIIAGLPIKETATTMGKTEAAVKMLQQRALKNLRQLLQDKGITAIN